DDDVFGERIGGPGRDIRTVVYEALVFQQPRRPARSGISGRNGPMPIRHGFGGIGDVLVKGLRTGGDGRIQRKLPARLEVELARRALTRRPTIVLLPFI